VLLSNGDGTFTPQTPIPNATLFISGNDAVLADSNDPGSQAGSIDYFPGAAGFMD
jgi:hypothetical protein